VRAQALFIGRRIAGGGGLEHRRSIASLSQENKIYHERTRKLLTEHTETLRRLDSTIGREHDKAKPPPSPPPPPPPITLKPASWAPPPGGACAGTAPACSRGAGVAGCRPALHATGGGACAQPWWAQIPWVGELARAAHHEG
jgi:hypothetical protein